MILTINLLFWTLTLIIAYVYLGHPLILIILPMFIQKPVAKGNIAPLVSMIIAARNEEKTIREKLKNALNLDYPEDKLEIIVASDGSRDKTNEIVGGFRDKRIKLVSAPDHIGKSSIQNLAVNNSKGNILVFSDASAIYEKDALRKLMANFADEMVGCVTGRLIYVNPGDTPVSKGEGIYWKYEFFLRRKESDMGILSMASGCFFAVRRELFTVIPADTSDDFILPLNTVKNGYRVVCEPEAIVYDKVARSTAGLFRTKVRIIAKDLKSFFYFRNLLNPFYRFPIFWSLVSHKLLRWLAPLFIIGIFICNLFLLTRPFYLALFILQILFYILAALGYLCQKLNKENKLLAIPFAFCIVNIAALWGILKFVTGRACGKWQPIR